MALATRTFTFKNNLGPSITTPGPEDTTACSTAQSEYPHRKQACSRPRSRSGCAACKRRRVKCDETFPVCRRCQNRGELCESVPRLNLEQFQLESPWIADIRIRSGDDSRPLCSPDKRLLAHWLEKASQIMVIDPDINPLSFPILEYLDRSPSLIYALQSLSAAHLNYFNPSDLRKCLEERDKAINLLRGELAAPAIDVFPVFQSILLLGFCSAWTGAPSDDFGLEHLRGARALIDSQLLDPSVRKVKHSTLSFMLGSYLYWEMACAFLVPDSENMPVNAEHIITALLDVGSDYNPIGGYCTEIFYFIGILGRYCRSIVDGRARDLSLEKTLERLIRAWQPNRDGGDFPAMCAAYRHHALINLAAICKRRPIPDQDSLVEPWPGSPTVEEDSELEESIHEMALTTVRSLTALPPSNKGIVLQAIPLLTAGAELRAQDKKERQSVYTRFKELYSLNHLRVNLSTLRLLDELWELRDSGKMITWLELMLQKGWNIMLG